MHRQVDKTSVVAESNNNHIKEKLLPLYNSEALKYFYTYFNFREVRKRTSYTPYKVINNFKFNWIVSVHLFCWRTYIPFQFPFQKNSNLNLGFKGGGGRRAIFFFGNWPLYSTIITCEMLPRCFQYFVIYDHYYYHHKRRRQRVSDHTQNSVFFYSNTIYSN